MWPEPRGVVFDMDDTLYPYRRFLRSGFAAVAAHLEEWHGVPARESFRLLVRASRGPARGHELQACLRAFRLPENRLPLLLRVLLRHEPRLTLPPATRRTLRAFREGGWRLGVLTNGPRDLQARKVRTLGLASLVDAVVFATTHGTGLGKPDPAPFAEVARRIGVPPARVLFVGDDEACDVRGTLEAGMRAARCAIWTAARDGSTPATAAPLLFRSFGELRRLAGAPLEARHVA